MKVNWQKRTLADVCQIKPPKSEARSILAETDLVSFVPMEDLGIDQKILVATQTKTLAEVAGSYTYFADGDVLLAKITPCFENGKLGIASDLTNGIGFGSSEYIVFRPNELVNKEWLYYFLSRDEFRLEGAERMTGAVGHKRVPKEFIEAYPIPVPPLPEQQRIVSILDEASAAIAKAKERAEKYLQYSHDLAESYLQTIFTKRSAGWEEKQLRDLISDIMTGPFGSMLHKSDYVSSGVPVINPQNIVNGNIIPLQSTMVSQQTRERLSKYILKEKDLVLARRGEMGRCAIATKEHVGWLCGTGSLVIRVKKDVNEKYLAMILGSAKIKSILENDSIGATMSNLNQGILLQINIPFPPLSEQHSIVDTFDAISTETKNLDVIYQKKMASLEELRKSILHKAFNGELSGAN